MTNGGLWQIGWIWMSLTEKNVSGVPLIAFTAVRYVCASCLSLGACSCSSHVEGWQLLPLHCLEQWCRAGSAGERYGRTSRESWCWAEVGAGFSWINKWEWEWKVLERHLQEAGWQQWQWVTPLGALLGHTISIAPFPLKPLVMLILVILFFIFYFSSLTSSHRLFLFSFQHPSVFSHCYSCCSSGAHTGGVAHSDLQSWHGRELVITSNTVSHFPSGFRQGRTLLHLLHFQVVYSWILGFF